MNPLGAAALNALLNNTPLWLSDTVPTVEKIADLPNNVVPASSPNDCEMKPSQPGAAPTCEVVTSIGTYNNGIFDDGVHGRGTMSGTLFQYSGNTGYTFVQYSGTKVGGYRALDPSKLTYSSGKYRYAVPLDFTLLAGNGQAATVATPMAFSNNGKYMVTIGLLGTGNGIMLFDMTTLKGKVIANMQGATIYDQTTPGAGNLAVSDNGRFVASGITEKTAAGVEKGLRVYDTSTCFDQLMIDYKIRNSCEYKNIWTGTMRGVSYGSGIALQVGNAERPLNVRFAANNKVTFSAITDYVSPTNFHAATYSATVDSGTAPHIAVLGMGDSYIAGEGAYYYRAGTDTWNNHCHTSWLSYPYTQGRKYYPTVQSVACSGAVMDDITDSNDRYTGQVNNKKPFNDRANADLITEEFIPGYSNQLKFNIDYSPQSVLISVGGNDVGFADVISRCISVDSCYNTYEDRYELMKTIIDAYPTLIKTYEKIKTTNPGVRIYVSGYPQIVNPNPVAGACAVNVHMNAAELQFASRLTTYLNTVIARAAGQTGVLYVNNETALNGYRLCDSGPSKAVNGLTQGDDLALPVNIPLTRLYTMIGIGRESYHPNALGHKLLGNNIANQTKRFTAAMPAKSPAWSPFVDATNALLSGAPKTGRPIEHVTWTELTKTQYFYERGKPVVVDYGDADVQPGTNVQIIINSTPTLLYDGKLDPSTDKLTVRLPESVEPGFHELHLYAMNSAGQRIDYRDVVYVGDDASATPSCHFTDAARNVDGSLLDADADGINDACDGTIGDQGADATDITAIPEEQPFIEEAPEVDETPPPPDQKDDESDAETSSTPTAVDTSSQVDEQILSSTPAVENASNQANAQVLSAVSIQPAQTFTLPLAETPTSAYIATVVSKISAQTTEVGLVLGTTDTPHGSSVANTKQKITSGSRVMLFLLAAVGGICLVGLLAFWRKRRSATI